MFRRTVAKISVLLLAAALFTQSAMAAQVLSQLNVSLVSQGAIEYKLEADSAKRYKVLIEKDSVRYTYDIAGKATERFPLQLGNGEYTVMLLENIEGTQYRSVESNKVSLSLKNQNTVFLNSVQIVNWSADDPAVKKAAQLVAGKKSDSEKISAIYQYITKSVVYDYAKAKNISGRYLPDINDTYATNKGICYDYAALMASMLRSVGVPAKLIMGTSRQVGDRYHAWNEVYDSGSGKWIIIDATADAPLVKAGRTCSMSKKTADYTVDKIY